MPLDPSCNCLKYTCRKPNPILHTFQRCKKSLPDSHRAMSARKRGGTHQIFHLWLESSYNAFGFCSYREGEHFFPPLAFLRGHRWCSRSFVAGAHWAVMWCQLSLGNFYQQLNKDRFREIRAFAKKMLSLFGSTYLCEKTISVMNLNKSRVRARLTESYLRDILRTNTTAFEPDLAFVLQSRSQYHPSH